MSKNKKILLIVALVLDLSLTAFFLTISIIMLSTMPSNEALMADAINRNGPFIGYLQQNPTVYFLGFVLPMFVILAANVAALVLYVKKQGKAEEPKPVGLNDLSEEEKAALRAELLKDMGVTPTEEKKD